MSEPRALSEGDICPIELCGGILVLPPVENCSCFNFPPCGPCLENRPTCPKCGFEVEFEE